MVLEDKPEYVLTIDYDSWFNKEHVLTLLELMEMYPEIDCIFPAQVMRENDKLLAGLLNPDGTNKSGWTEDDAKQHIIPAVTGHFGLTIFRSSCFDTLKKPWFLGVPNDDGEWKKGRLDPDIYFWHNFAKSGFHAAMSPQVKIGHMQLMAAWPNEEMTEIVYKSVSECDNEGCPEWCVPQLGAENE
jgi:hypothetical protein